MFNVLIVDDENFVIKSLISTIAWSSLNLTIVATFSNGVDALEFIQTHPIDIVITDIRMPGFTGLDLCSMLYSQYPHIQIILISGYTDFIYAQKAIKYNVLGYCVKPVDFDEFTLLLRKAVTHLTHSSSNEDIIDCIENEEYESISTYLINHCFNPKAFYIMVSIGSESLDSSIPGNKVTFKFGPHKYLYILDKPFDAPTYLTSLPPALKGVGIYPHAVEVSQLKTLLYDTIEMSYQFFFSKSPYLCTTLIPPTNPLSLSQLQVALSTNNLCSVKLVLSDMLDAATSQNYNIGFALKVCNLFNTHYMLHHQLEDDDLYIYSFDHLTQKFENFSQMLNCLYNMLSQEPTITDLPTTYNNHFIQMIRYINQHYMDEITIGDISEQLNLNPNYVSQLFKKETGSTYTKYLTQLRMEKAKMLLIQSDLSISDICEKVGYNDYFYFLKTFKKHFGLSPGKYKSQLNPTYSLP